MKSDFESEGVEKGGSDVGKSAGKETEKQNKKRKESVYVRVFPGEGWCGGDDDPEQAVAEQLAHRSWRGSFAVMLAQKVQAWGKGRRRSLVVLKRGAANGSQPGSESDATYQCTA